MEVSFDQLGTGQVGRWCYQVIGNDGPIPNPRRIRYLAEPPDGLGDLMTSLAGGASASSALAGYAQVAQLGLTATNLAVSIATLLQLQQQTRMLREIQTDIRILQTYVSEVLERTKRIDIAVAESNLRPALHHAFRSSIKDDELDLDRLAFLVSQAINRFQPALGPASIGLSPGLVLSADVGEMLAACMNLMWAARRTALEAHNRNCRGDATRVIRDSPMHQETRRQAELVALYVAHQKRINKMSNTVGDRLAESWRFQGNSGEYRDLIKKRLKSNLRDDFAVLESGQAATDLVKALETDPGFVSLDSNIEDVVEEVDKYLRQWLVGSNAGLLWALRREISLRDDSKYWQALDGWGAVLPDCSSSGVTLALTSGVGRDVRTGEVSVDSQSKASGNDRSA